jgi:hypothetical protein
MRDTHHCFSAPFRHFVRRASRCLLLALGIFPLAGLAADAVTPTSLTRAEPEAVGMSSARFVLLDTMLRQHVDDGRVAGLVAGVARHGKIVYLQSMGWQDIEAGQAMREDSIFQIRSLSKSITSLAVMQLVEQGRLTLEDPVSRYIPSFADMEVFVNPDDPDNSPLRAPARAITIRGGCAPGGRSWQCLDLQRVHHCARACHRDCHWAALRRLPAGPRPASAAHDGYSVLCSAGES